MKKSWFSRLAAGSVVSVLCLSLSIVHASALSEIQPLARYDFSDASNLGKDVTGNGYDLGTNITQEDNDRKKWWNNQANTGKGTADNGELRLNGADGLVLPESNDFSEKLQAFTLNFSVRVDKDDKRVVARAIAGFGYDINGKNEYLFFATKQEDPRKLYLFASDLMVKADGTATGYKFAEVPALHTFSIDATEYANVSLSIQPGGKAFVKVDNDVFQLPATKDANGLPVVKQGATVPANWSDNHLRSGDRRFSLGCNIAYGHAYHGFMGWLKNVTVYDFAMTEDQVASYWENSGKLLVPVTTVSPGVLPDGTTGVTYNQQLTTDGSAPIMWSISGGTLPNGLTLATDGTLSGTPSSDGTFMFSVRASNDTGSTTKDFTLIIKDAPKPVTTVITAVLPDGTAGMAYNQQLTADGAAPIMWSVSGGTLPNGLTLAENGTLSGTPTQNGIFSFTVKAANATGMVSKEIMLNIAAASVTSSATSSSDNAHSPKTGENHSPVLAFLFSAMALAVLATALVTRKKLSFTK